MAALSALGRHRAGAASVVVPTLGAVAKTPDDRDLVTGSLDSYAFG